MAAAVVLSASLGFAAPVFADTVAGILNPDGKLTYLGTLGETSTFPSDINDAGQVVGQSTTVGDDYGSNHAFITGPNGVGMTDLGTLGGDFSYATRINDAGQVGGHSYTADGSDHAFITGPNGVGMTDLNSLLNPGTPVVINYAAGINNHGQILVIVSGVPEPETYAMLLAGLVLIGFTARFRKTA